MKEKLSAWMDDELNRFEERALVKRLERDSELRGYWERCHLIREAIRHELDTMAPGTLAERVSSAIRSQPPARRRRMVRLAGTAAIAASVAIVALVGVQFLSDPRSPGRAPGTVAHAPAAPVQAASAWRNRQPEQAQNLNVFLVEHNEFSSTNSVSGMFPYVRIVSHGDDSRRQ